MRPTSAQDREALGPCPTGGDLVCISTGELPPDEWRIIKPHLERCPACQAELRAIRDTVDAWARREESGLSSSDRAAANVTRFRQALAARSRSARDVRGSIGLRRWLSIAAALFALVLTITIARTPPVGDVDEILARLAQREHAAVRRDLPFLVRVIAPPPDGRSGTTAAAQKWREGPDVPEQAAARLKAHGFDLRRPLSVAPVQAWRASRPARRDRVSRRDGHLIVQVSAGGDGGALGEIEVVIDEARFEVVKQSWVFAGFGRVECELLVPDNPPASGAADRPSSGGAR